MTTKFNVPTPTPVCAEIEKNCDFVLMWLPSAVKYLH